MAMYNKNGDTSYTLGITLTIELIKFMPNIVKKVFYHTDFLNSKAYLIVTDLCQKNHILLEPNNKIFNKLSQKDNCYVIGEFDKFQRPIDANSHHLVLVNPSDAGNIGTIMRSALGFGYNNIVIIKPGVDVFNPKAVRSSMGSIFHLNIQYLDSIDEYLRMFPNHHLYPFMLKANMSLSKININKDEYHTLVFGNEATGLDDSYLNYGTPIIIHHSNLIDSLNLPIAVSIALYEFTK